MDIYGFMRYLESLEKYMIEDEKILISGIG